MVGNAVPPNLAYYLAKKIAEDMQKVIKIYKPKEKCSQDNIHLSKDNYVANNYTSL